MAEETGVTVKRVKVRRGEEEKEIAPRFYFCGQLVLYIPPFFLFDTFDDIHIKE
jgi:hypothetical protein